MLKSMLSCGMFPSANLCWVSLPLIGKLAFSILKENRNGSYVKAPITNQIIRGLRFHVETYLEIVIDIQPRSIHVLTLLLCITKYINT